MTQKQYAKMVKEVCPKSPLWKDCICAFVIGGLICTLGQGLTELYGSIGLPKQDAGTAASMTLVALSALLTGLSLYDDIAKVAGAGTLVPITGFANAIAAPAVEFQTEGFILGVGAKIFTIAGPVIVYGLSASAVYGLIYFFTTLSKGRCVFCSGPPALYLRMDRRLPESFFRESFAAAPTSARRPEPLNWGCS